MGSAWVGGPSDIGSVQGAGQWAVVSPRVPRGTSAPGIAIMVIALMLASITIQAYGGACCPLKGGTRAAQAGIAVGEA